MAVTNGHLQVVDLLLSKGAKADEVSMYVHSVTICTQLHYTMYLHEIHGKNSDGDFT